MREDFRYQQASTALNRPLGGQGGIRTHGRLPPTAVFKTAALNHSATCPQPKERLSERSCSVSRAGRKGNFDWLELEPRNRVNRIFSLVAKTAQCASLSIAIAAQGREPKGVGAQCAMTFR